MIQDHTIDQTLIELARTMKALKALRAARRGSRHVRIMDSDFKHQVGEFWSPEARPQHAAALRASMDLTRKLADLRQFR